MPPDSLEDAIPEASFGLVHAPFRAHDMMQAQHLPRRPAQRRCRASRPPRWAGEPALRLGARNPAARYVVTHQVEVAGRSTGWRDSAARLPSKPTTRARSLPLILYGGSALSLMLFAVMHSNARHRRRCGARLSTSRAVVTRSAPWSRTCRASSSRWASSHLWRVIHISRGITALTGATPTSSCPAGCRWATSSCRKTPSHHGRTRGRPRASRELRGGYRMCGRDQRVRWVSERGRVATDPDDARLPAGRGDHRHHRAQDGGRGHPQPRLRRHPDPTAQPPFPARPPAPGAGQCPPPRPPWRPALHRHRPLQAGERHLRPRGRRSAPAAKSPPGLTDVREGDTVARLGGDEFVVMLEDLGSSPPRPATGRR